jgi:putative chitinase
MATKKSSKGNTPINITAKDLAGLLSKIEEKSEQREERLVRMLASLVNNNTAPAAPSADPEPADPDAPKNPEGDDEEEDPKELARIEKMKREQRKKDLKTNASIAGTALGYAALGPALAAPIGAAIIGATGAWKIGKGAYDVMQDRRKAKEEKAEKEKAKAEHEAAGQAETEKSEGKNTERKPKQTVMQSLLGIGGKERSPLVGILEKTNKHLEKQTRILEKIHHALADKPLGAQLGASGEGETWQEGKKENKGFFGKIMDKLTAFMGTMKLLGPILTSLGAFIAPAIAVLGKLAVIIAPLAIAIGAFILAVKGLNWLAEKFGGGKEPINDEEKDQDSKNWEKMNWWEKSQSGVGRGIEKVGDAVGLDPVARAAQRSRIEKETAYLQNKEQGIQSNKSALNPGGYSDKQLKEFADKAKQQKESAPSMMDRVKGFFGGKKEEAPDITGNLKKNTQPQPSQSSQPALPAQQSTQKGGGWSENMRKSLAAVGIVDAKAQAFSLAHIEAESGGKARSESLNYSPERLMQVFPSKFKNLEEAKQVVSQGQEAIGNKIYGGRMGNAADEGYKYRGRGLIQLTGKNNYTDMSKKLGIDLVNNPDLANDPEVAPKIAAQFLLDRQKAGKNLSDPAHMQKVVGYVDRDGKETAKRVAMAEKYMGGTSSTQDKTFSGQGGSHGGGGGSDSWPAPEAPPMVAATTPAPAPEAPPMVAAPTPVPPLKQDATVVAANTIPAAPAATSAMPVNTNYPEINPVPMAPTGTSIEPPTPRPITPQSTNYPDIAPTRGSTGNEYSMPPEPRPMSQPNNNYPPTDAGYQRPAPTMGPYPPTDANYPRPIGPVYGMGQPSVGMGIPGQIGPVVSVGMSKGPHGTSGGVGIGGIRIGDYGIGNVNIGMQNGKVFGGGGMAGPIFGGMGSVGIGRGPYGGTTMGGGWSGPLGGAPIGPTMPAPMGMPMGMPMPVPSPMGMPMGMGQPPITVGGGISTGPHGTGGGVSVGNIPILGGLGGISIGKNPFSNKPSIGGSWGGPVLGGMGGISGGTGPYGTTMGGGWSNGGIVGGGFGGGMMGGMPPMMGGMPPMMGGMMSGYPPPSIPPHPMGGIVGGGFGGGIGGGMPPIISGGFGTGPYGTTGGVSVQGPNYGGSIGRGPFGTTGSIGGVFTLPPMNMPNVTPSPPNDAAGVFLNNKSVENVGIKETAMASPKIAPVVVNNTNNSQQGSSAQAGAVSQLEGDPRSDSRHPFNRYQDTITKYV